MRSFLKRGLFIRAETSSAPTNATFVGADLVSARMDLVINLWLSIHTGGDKLRPYVNNTFKSVVPR